MNIFYQKQLQLFRTAIAVVALTVLSLLACDVLGQTNIGAVPRSYPTFSVSDPLGFQALSNALAMATSATNSSAYYLLQLAGMTNYVDAATNATTVAAILRENSISNALAQADIAYANLLAGMTNDLYNAIAVESFKADAISNALAQVDAETRVSINNLSNTLAQVDADLLYAIQTATNGYVVADANALAASLARETVISNTLAAADSAIGARINTLSNQLVTADTADRAYAHSLYESLAGTNAFIKLVDPNSPTNSWVEWASNTLYVVSISGSVTTRTDYASFTNGIWQAVLAGSNALVSATNTLTAAINTKVSTNTFDQATNQLTQAINSKADASITNTSITVGRESGSLSSNMTFSAWQNPTSATNWTWTSDGTQITLTGYTGPNDVIIPDMLDGLPVTTLGAQLFSPTYEGTPITTVSGGQNISTVKDSAFYSCWLLSSVDLPDMTTIEAGGFGSCTNLSIVSSVKITSLGQSAFAGCYKLASINLPSVTTVSPYAFRFCTALTSVYFGQNQPAPATGVFQNITANQVTIYVTNPTATGWGTTWNGMPVARMPVSADGATMYQAHLNTMEINNGFESQYAQTLTFDPATRVLTVTPTGTTFKVTAHGVTYTKTGAQNSQVPPVSPDLFYYYGAGGTLVGTNVAWTISGEAQVAYVKMNTNDASVVFTVDERHGVNISDEWHKQQHLTMGSKWSSGMALFHNASDTSTAVASTGAGTAVSIQNGIMYDEDVQHITVTNGVQSSVLLTTNNSGVFPVMYKDTTNNWVRTAGTAFPFLWSGDVPQVVSNGALTAVAEDRYFVYWLVSVGGFRGTNIFLIPHPVTFTSTALAQSGATPYTLGTVLGGLPSPEMLVSHRLIFQFNASAPNANPTAVKSSKLRDVTDFRSLSSGVIVAGMPGAATAIVHADTTGRDAADSHPVTAISGMDAYVTNGQPMSITFTNTVQMHDGVLDGTNGVYFLQPNDTTKYWILFPLPPQ